MDEMELAAELMPGRAEHDLCAVRVGGTGERRHEDLSAHPNIKGLR